MTSAEATDAVLLVLKSALASSPYSSWPVKWPDREVTVPDGAAGWFSADIDRVGSRKSSLGDVQGQSTWETSKMLTVDAFVKPSQADLPLDSLEDFLLESFEGVRTDGVCFRSVEVRDLPSDETWDRLRLSAVFEYDRLH